MALFKTAARLRVWSSAGVLAGLLAGCALPPGPAATEPDPLDAAAKRPPLVYGPAFAGYRPWAEQGVAPWRLSNDEAARAGGWRAYAREASAPASAPSAAPAASVPRAGAAPHQH